MSIHLLPPPQAELAIPLASCSGAIGPQEDPIDAANPLILPSLRQRDPARARAGQPASAELSGSAPAEAGARLPGGPGRCPPGAAGEVAPPPSSPSEDLRSTAAGQLPAGVQRARSEAEPPKPGQPAAGGGAAIAAIAGERRRQIEEFGHTVERDLRLRPTALANQAMRYMVAVHEDLQFRRGEYRAAARRHAAQAGAMCLAIIDWLDAGGGQ